ncbi:unnamed protein product, partial [Iphiclides podalirius]
MSEASRADIVREECSTYKTNRPSGPTVAGFRERRRAVTRRRPLRRWSVATVRQLKGAAVFGARRLFAGHNTVMFTAQHT